MIYVWSGKDLYATTFGMPATHRLADSLGVSLVVNDDGRTGRFNGLDLTFADYYYQPITDYALFEIRPTIEAALRDARKFAGYDCRTTIGQKVVNVESVDSLKNIHVRFVQSASIEVESEMV
jgi:hypothetical protein